MAMDRKSHHVSQPVFIAEARVNGQFQVVWNAPAPLRAQPWSPDIPGNAAIISELGIGWTTAQQNAKLLVTTFFATDRRYLKDEKEPRDRFSNERGELVYGIAKVSIPPGHDMGKIERPTLAWLGIYAGESADKHLVMQSLEVVNDAKSYFSKVQAMSNPKHRRAFIFIHAFNTRFEDAALRTAQMADDLDIQAVPLFYSWPSGGHFERSLLTLSGRKEYTADEQAAEWAEPHLKRFLEEFCDQGKFDEIFVIAHSMGARVTTRALATLLQDRSDLRPRIKELVLAAPDIDAGVFKEQILPRLTKWNTSVTLYASSNDKALKESGNAHGDYSRAGLAGKDLVVATGMETIDATNVNTDFLGHSYVVEASPLLTDLTLLINEHMRAARRPRLAPHEMGTSTYWEFRRAAQ